MASTTAVSSPGKVLLAGGYLVLDPACSGLVFSLSARIHAIARPLEGDEEYNRITIISPQFENATWKYSVEVLEGTKGVKVDQINRDTISANVFVETTLRYVLSYLSQPKIPSLKITILADNDYYSQPSPEVARFNSFNVPISSVNKTGLGSSAALVTSLTTCLIQHLSHSIPSHTSKNELPLRTIHNLAQASHCAAQGKVGSGFDVAAASYGSCIYRRFPPSTLHAIPDANSADFVNKLRSTVDSDWDMTLSKINVPDGLGLMMCDVDCGSSTPGMVRSVLDWRSKDPNAEELWQQLNQDNKEFMNSLKKLGDEQELIKSLGFLQTIRNKEIPEIRKMIRRIGEAANVPIEPSSQTQLLDAASNVSGVLGGVVPGAGGFDAVCFLYVDIEDTREKLEKFVHEYRGEGGKVTPLNAREDHQGVKIESMDGYKDVLHLLDKEI